MLTPDEPVAYDANVACGWHWENRLNMKTISSLAVMITLAVLGVGPRCLAAGEAYGVAIAIIYDTSGSMRDAVPGKDGRATPKYVIANRALITLADQVQAFATNKGAANPRRIDAGLWVFHGDGARQVVPFGPFDAAVLQDWARHFSNPSGNTPLGNALNVAARAVLESPLPHKHVLVITDGMNTAGPEPSAIMPRLKRLAEQKGAGLSVHFIAFNVDAKTFEPVKRLGATVVSAADEKQLNTQVNYILQQKILLEEEEPKKAQ